MRKGKWFNILKGAQLTYTNNARKSEQLKLCPIIKIKTDRNYKTDGDIDGERWATVRMAW